MIQRALERAIVAAADTVFLDPANAGTAATPASITSGQTSIASIGDVGDDVGAALEAFDGDLPTASWITHPMLSAKIGLRAGGFGAGAGLGANGGVLAGLPVLVSPESPVDQIALVDAGAIIFVDEGAEIRRAAHAMIEMDTEPTGSGFSPPTAASAQLVSLFQTNLRAALIVRAVNWTLAREDAVVLITGATYATPAS